MADSEKRNQEDEQAAAAATETEERPAEPVEEGAESRPEAEAAPGCAARSRRGIYLLLTFLLLAVIGLAAAAVWGWQWMQTSVDRLEAGQSSLERESGDQAQRVEALSTKVRAFNPEKAVEQAVGRLEGRVQDRLDAFGSDLEALRGAVAEAGKDRAALVERQAELEASVARLSQVVGRAQRDWVLAEVEYLLGMAQRRLHLARDTAAAAGALEAADGRLADLADPTLLPVRETLASEIAALRTYHRPDVDGLALRLKGLSGVVESLPSAGGESAEAAPAARAQTAPASPAEADSVGDWVGAQWQRFTHNLTQLVVVRHDRREQADIAARADRLLADRELYLQLHAARLAAVERDQSAFDARIDRALEVLESHYDGGDPRVENVRGDLEELRGTELAPALPEVGGSLRQLRKLTAVEGEE